MQAVYRFGLLLICGTFMWCGCGENENASDELPPAKPRWVERSSDDLYPQQGIRADPAMAVNDGYHAVRLEWYANTEPDVLGYRIYRCPENVSPLRFYVVADLRVSVDLQEGLDRYFWVDKGDSTGGAPLRLLDPHPETGDSRGYFWMMLVYDSLGNRSERSDTLYYRLINNPRNLSVARDSTDVYSASWSFTPNPDIIISYYMLRVYARYGGLDAVVWYQKVQRYESQEVVYMDFSESFGPLYADCTYVCQVNVIANRPTTSHADSLAGAAVYTSFVYRN
ncbi:hypothetical protein EHM69_01030 [candidate division KSB1 bacterium]|nr:MAG: hypothetical protein EHM69_01030 [candidate division KSB1 bacterium]